MQKNQRVVCFAALFQLVEQLSDTGIQSSQTIVIIGRHLAQTRRVDTDLWQRFHISAGKRNSGTAKLLAVKRQVGIGVVDRKKKGLV